MTAPNRLFIILLLIQNIMIMKNIIAFTAVWMLVCATHLHAQVEVDEKLSLADKQFQLYAYNLALKSYNEILQSNPLNAHALSKTGLCYLQLGQAEKAIPYFEKAVAQQDFDAQILFHYGEALMMTGDYSKASTWFNLYAEENQAKGSHFVQVAQWASQNTGTSNAEFEVKPEMLNTVHSDFLPAFYGDKVVYGSTRPDIQKKIQTNQPSESWAGGTNPQIFVTALDGKSGFLQRPTLLKGDLQSSYNEGPVAFSQDGKKVAFCRNNFINGNRQLADEGVNLSLYTADVVNGTWMNIRAFSFNGSDFGTGFPAYNANGTQLYFSSNRKGTGQGGWDIYRSDWDGTKWSAPINLGSEINTPGNEISPSIDGSTMYFASDWHPGFGGLDVFSCNISGVHISDLKNMGKPINSISDDYGFIYQTSKSTGYLTSSRQGGKGLEDIYRISRKTQDFLITVTDQDQRLLKGATIDLSACGMSLYSTASDGKFRFARPANAETCRAAVSMPGYQTLNFDLKSGSPNMEIQLLTLPKPEPVMASTEIKPVPTSKASVPENKPEPVVIAQSEQKNEKPVTHSSPSPSKSSAGTKAVPVEFESSPIIDQNQDRVNGYAVQVIALPKGADQKVISKYEDLSQFGNVYVKEVGGVKRIRVGVFADEAKAKLALKSIQKSHSGAFVVDEKFVDKVMIHTGEIAVAEETKEITPAKPEIKASKPETKTAKSVTETKPVTAEPELVIMRYAVQLAAYSNDGDAINMSKFMPVSDLGRIYTVPETGISKVRLGVWEDPAAAEAVQKEVIKRGFVDALVVNEKSTKMTDKLVIKTTSGEPAGKSPAPVEASVTTTTQPKTKANTTSAITQPKVESKPKSAPKAEPKKVEPVAMPKAQYMVRIAAYKDVSKFDDLQIAGIPAVKDIRKSGKVSVIYLTGFKSLEDALDAKNTVVKRGLKDAYLVKEENKTISKVQL
jgi:tetratricopeptide (TPR) repeat protein/cell division septation protein DedD